MQTKGKKAILKELHAHGESMGFNQTCEKEDIMGNEPVALYVRLFMITGYKGVELIDIIKKR